MSWRSGASSSSRLILALGLLLVPLALFAIALGINWSHPHLRDYLLGMMTIGIPGLALVFCAVLDGTIGERVARFHRNAAGGVLRRSPGVYRVVKGVDFYGFDIDYVVIARCSVLALQVKHVSQAATSRQLDPLVRDHWAEQACRGAATLRLVLQSRGVEPPVLPVVLLVGSGAEVLADRVGRADGGVRFSVLTDRSWLVEPLGSPPCSDERASAVADALSDYIDAHDRVAAG